MSAMSAAATAVIAGERVFTAGCMPGIANMAVSITRLIAAEVIELLIAACRDWSVIAVTRIEAVVDVSVETVRARGTRGRLR